MNKKQVTSVVKKLTAGVLAVGLVVTGIAVYPKQADAAEVADKVIYSDEYDISKFWNADETKRTAPVMEGYVFGGWFEQVEEATDSTETYTDNEEVTYYKPLMETKLKEAVPKSAYAKFVPAQVLSVKAQNEKKVTQEHIQNMKNKLEDDDEETVITDEDKFYVRLISSLDSSNYQLAGFNIYLNNKIPVYKDATNKTPTESSKIYRGIMVGDTKTDAVTLFGGVSKYVSTWRLTEIDWPDNVKLIIYVRPYWKTMDGTTVNGLAKYIHIEDQYLNYINVPVNLLGGEDIAAGTVTLTYTNTMTDSLVLKTFEPGRILPDMKYSYDEENKTIKMVGNTDQKVDKYNEGETIYANLRFAKPTEDTEFEIEQEENTFCDWNQEFVDVKKVWDTSYEKVETTTYE